MHRTLVGIMTLALLSFWTTSAVAQEVFGWIVSSSSTDPGANLALPVVNAEVQLYLWFDCVDPFGGVAMECRLASTFPFAVGPFLPLNGAIATGSPDLLLAFPCAFAPVLLGSQTYWDDGSGGTVCLVPSAANNKNVTVDCRPVGAREWPNAVNGFSSEPGQGPCVVGFVEFCASISTAEASWASIKSLYK